MRALTFLLLLFFNPRILLVEIILNLATAFNDFISDLVAALTAFIRAALGTATVHDKKKDNSANTINQHKKQPTDEARHARPAARLNHAIDTRHSGGPEREQQAPVPD
jgi:hypothetical protein